MKPRALLLLTASSALLCACASAPAEPQRQARQPRPLPPELADRLGTVRGERQAYPSFRDIPFTPGDVRTPAQFRQAVQAVSGEGAALGAWAARNPAEIADPEAYAAQARRELGVGPEDVPPPDQAARIEALARELRKRAEPPPPLPE